MTGKEALKLRDRVKYNLVSREDKQAVDIAFDALEEMENLRAADACPLTGCVNDLFDEDGDPV